MRAVFVDQLDETAAPSWQVRARELITVLRAADRHPEVTTPKLRAWIDRAHADFRRRGKGSTDTSDRVRALGVVRATMGDIAAAAFPDGERGRALLARLLDDVGEPLRDSAFNGSKATASLASKLAGPYRPLGGRGRGGHEVTGALKIAAMLFSIARGTRLDDEIERMKHAAREATRKRV
jgi:hypothetical protein